MRVVRPVAAAVALSFVAISSCDEQRVLAPKPPGIAAVAASANSHLPEFRIAEFHYDNTGTDANEKVEVSFPTGQSLTGWSVIPYNGNGGGTYAPAPLLTSGTVTGCGGTSGRSVVVVNLAGLQNGPPDGIVLAGPSGVSDYLSYEGSFTATNGVALGLLLPDIGVQEGESTPSNFSLQRTPAGTWNAPAANTFGVCNDDETPPPAITSVTVTPASASVETGVSQAFTAVAKDAGDNVVPSTFTWTSTAGAVASVSTTGVATGLTAGSTLIIAAAPNGVADTSSLTVTNPPPPPDLVISQVYGGGGNSGAFYTHDFVEIFNRGSDPVNLTGWSMQRTSTAGTAWDVTLLSGTIQPNQYFLIRGSAGAGGTAPLPTPDVIGSATLGATNGKVVLAKQTAAFTVACPGGGTVADRVGYGADASDAGCGALWGRTTNLSNTTAAFRLDDGCIKTGNSNADFYVDAPAPRNSASPLHTCGASAASIVINEIMADPFNADGGASWGEWFEVKNTGAAPVDLSGWTIASQGQPNHVIGSSVVVAPGGYAVLGRGFDPALNGGITIDYNYFTGSSTTIFLDATDFLSLRDATGALVDFVRWTSSTTMVRGVTRGVRDASVDNLDAAGANWGYSTTTFGDGDFGTPDADNGVLAATPPVNISAISFSGRLFSDPALPVGFEDQLFATLRDGTGQVVPTTFTWASETPSVASIDQFGVMHGLAAGTATFRATAAFDGSSATVSFPIAVAMPGSASYGNHVEFGTPADGDASDDEIVSRFTYVGSYNRIRNTPNWVSYNLEATHIGGAVDRCDCFTHDPLLPGAFAHISTSNYTGAGAIAGFGIDRGHLARSFDRTSGALDNATSYYFSNIVPQAADLNQGPWAQLENFLGAQATGSNKEVYIVTGVAGNAGSVKNEGLIVIPAHTWKVAVIMPRDEGLADVHSYTDVEVIAVIMPNTPGIRNVPWQTYVTTVDAVEALSGYDVLSLLPDGIETIVESSIGQTIGNIEAMINALGVNAGNANSLRSKLDAAVRQAQNGNVTPAVNQLNALLNEIEALLRSGRLSPSDAAALSAAVRTVIATLSP